MCRGNGFVLDLNNRADANDPNQAQFKAFLNRLADAEVTRADYDWVRRLCSRHSMTAQEWPNITHEQRSESTQHSGTQFIGYAHSSH